ncbi:MULTISPECIES: hypothetical protein [Corynebacterium]|uniref:Secreted protein n=2 Tax=Corynebacterium glucuronolyticum TaxID=39791 RepID=A0A7T4JU46_9CORY|nr:MULTISPECIES: hypothetical protein [Corynebacterium]EEI61954.1 hypothetical protein HMPREF0293_2492 [Corynebacterium glucuronolyticum ATCC 51866]MCT1441192.1 hypothetical protein [Corynebacterium glucuronolyticum]MCT1562238.1 hypothetical protein [Corynebacterium glucuronolyticum]OFO43674.1 hypothetical protein HMPREF3044_02505 [Corynebacterium sp. HMSC073D01]QQB45453.1 hypothetical protein I6I10_07930 [Corynebacterium glucuronolyticum]
MKISAGSKKFIALAMAATVALSASACSKENKDKAADQVTETNVSTRTTQVTAAPEETSSSAAPSPTTKSEAPETLVEEQGAQPEIAPLPQVPAPEVLAPVEGEPASAEDAQAIADLVQSVTWAPTLRAFMGNFLENTCQRVIEQAGGQGAVDLSQVPEIPLEQIPQYQETRSTIDAVEDITVNGNEASAWVTTTSQGNTQSGTMKFLREDGRWKMCN